MWPEIEQVLEHIAMINFNEVLGKFYFKIKVEELIYHLIDKLLKRESVVQRRIGKDDADKIHEIKNEILNDFRKPPVLALLSRKHGISQTKMKSLFRQIYGDTIYNHFQKARMYEAVMLLKNSGLTISQVSDRLGFSNLSHFSRLFKKHYKQSPKKFTSVASGNF
jgi:AraC-like DNA-binding protein